MADIPCFCIDGQPFTTELLIFRFARKFKVNTATGVCFGGCSDRSVSQCKPFGSHSESLMLAGWKAGHIHQKYWQPSPINTSFPWSSFPSLGRSIRVPLLVFLEGSVHKHFSDKEVLEREHPPHLPLTSSPHGKSLAYLIAVIRSHSPLSGPGVPRAAAHVMCVLHSRGTGLLL